MYFDVLDSVVSPPVAMRLTNFDCDPVKAETPLYAFDVRRTTLPANDWDADRDRASDRRLLPTSDALADKDLTEARVADPMFVVVAAISRAITFVCEPTTDADPDNPRVNAEYLAVTKEVVAANERAVDFAMLPEIAKAAVADMPLAVFIVCVPRNEIVAAMPRTTLTERDPANKIVTA